MRVVKVLMTGGGTGGHVYPALSAAEVLPARAAALLGGDVSIELLFAGTERGDVARIVSRAGLQFALVDASPVRGKAPRALAAAAWHLVRGVSRARSIVARFGPDVVLATGGYASVPVALAAWSRRVPLVLYLPDIHPGWAVRLLAPLAMRIAVTGEASLGYLPRRKTVVTGYPVRPAYHLVDRAEGRRRLGYDDDDLLLLVTGATQGSHVINERVFRCLPSLLERCQLLHQTGAADAEAAAAAALSLSDAQRRRYRPVDYLDDMPAAMAAADLAVMRAGASSLAEPAAAGLPTVLVPATYAGAHQRFNARFVASRGAALLLEEADLARLPETVRGLLRDSDRLRRMSAAALALARPRAAESLADVVLEVAMAA